MMLYQVLNEENQIYAEFTELNQAMYAAQDFTMWDDEHYYHTEELELEVV